jgi:hypothetical protein
MPMYVKALGVLFLPDASAASLASAADAEAMTDESDADACDADDVVPAASRTLADGAALASEVSVLMARAGGGVRGRRGARGARAEQMRGRGGLEMIAQRCERCGGEKTATRWRA